MTGHSGFFVADGDMNMAAAVGENDTDAAIFGDLSDTPFELASLHEVSLADMTK